ncbi:MAG: uncharacterized protein JWM34_2085 [Ilumatobacteraceae bacterium]|nr:uncharacterized protein [Ilumatobacteraceae bacterium]
MPSGRPADAVTAHLDAATIVGLLADDHRRRCFAAVELGASSRDAVAEATSSTVADVERSLGRLVAAGLIVAGDAGFVVAGGAFQHAARVAKQRPPSTEFDDQPADVRNVLRSFVTDGRITQIPMVAGKRRVVLDWLAQGFEPGRRYSEQMVNLMLGQRHPDTAALRRYLVDEGLLDRADGQYWRSGGTALP